MFFLNNIIKCRLVLCICFLYEIKSRTHTFLMIYDTLWKNLNPKKHSVGLTHYTNLYLLKCKNQEGPSKMHRLKAKIKRKKSFPLFTCFERAWCIRPGSFSIIQHCMGCDISLNLGDHLVNGKFYFLFYKYIFYISIFFIEI